MSYIVILMNFQTVYSINYAPIFIRSETLSLKRNSKKTASVIFGKNVACNYCIEKMPRVIIALKNRRVYNSEEKTASVILKGKKRRTSVYSHGPSRPSYKGYKSFTRHYC